MRFYLIELITCSAVLLYRAIGLPAQAMYLTLVHRNGLLVLFHFFAKLCHCLPRVAHVHLLLQVRVLANDHVHLIKVRPDVFTMNVIWVPDAMLGPIVFIQTGINVHFTKDGMTKLGTKQLEHIMKYMGVVTTDINHRVKQGDDRQNTR